jgi:hypothetical protein
VFQSSRAAPHAMGASIDRWIDRRRGARRETEARGGRRRGIDRSRARGIRARCGVVWCGVGVARELVRGLGYSYVH